ncbi:GFA family protein [Pseudomonas sp. SCB32]|uniref:GFA family protein n=1 Tax=Pseudomonas sp. SCB32 TaxID=2653853 RepID=UPI0012658440|nr:GFA family protein [Pseudomonas sp. SCB32]
MTWTLAQPQHASCECGACRFEVAAVPAARFVCHCRLCQAFTGKAFSDVTILRASGVEVIGAENIAFRKYRPPPNISRGLCRHCGKPAIEFGGFGPVKIAFIPSSNFSRKDLLPPVVMHIFYHRRTSDALDDLPRYSGYLRSNLAVARLVVALFKS